jgi:hypothetical protein
MTASPRFRSLTVLLGLAAALAFAGPPLVSDAAAAQPLAVSPGTSSVAAGGSVAFKASGGKSPYTWTLETNGTGGTISGSGHYTAGPTGGATDVVQVTDATGATATATVTVTGTAAGPAASPDATIRPPNQ